jgi:hypothetical protein
MAARVLDLKTTKTADEIEAMEAWEDIEITGLGWQMLADLTGMEGAVLTSADGCVFIGDLADWDEDRGYLTLSLR